MRFEQVCGEPGARPPDARASECGKGCSRIPVTGRSFPLLFRRAAEPPARAPFMTVRNRGGPPLFNLNRLINKEVYHVRIFTL